MYDTIIIGAGMSGLAAGVRLAHFGQRVCILERHHRVGGLNSFYRRGGRDFDVGLHALTNYRPKGTRRGPLPKLLRQLRIGFDELALRPQRGSAICFPDLALRFSNDFALFESEVARSFPGQIDGLRRLVAALVEYEEYASPAAAVSAREVVGRHVDDPLLREMLLCPLLFYGGAREHDLEFGQFSVLFRSVFLEGLSRPAGGVRPLLARLVDRFREAGGELRLRTGVRRIASDGQKASGAVLDDGAPLAARRILSSAGWPETMRLCGRAGPEADPAKRRLSFVETVSVLDRQPRALGHDHTMVFYNDSDRFDYARPDEPVDLRSGVVCVPNNFHGEEPSAEGQVRVASLANHDRWAELAAGRYRAEKRVWYERMVASATRFVPDFRPAVIETEMFTPVTIRRFTGHDQGAVYGDPEKHYDGRTHLANLYLCGNDQGLVGIVGALTSGVTIANRYLLKDE